MSNLYSRVSEVRKMCELISKTLGHTILDPIDSEPHYSYQDNLITIDNRVAWMELHAPNEAGLSIRAFTHGGYSCKADEAALDRVADHIKSLYIASQWVNSPFYSIIESRSQWKEDYRS